MCHIIYYNKATAIVKWLDVMPYEEGATKMCGRPDGGEGGTQTSTGQPPHVVGLSPSLSKQCLSLSECKWNFPVFFS